MVQPEEKDKKLVWSERVRLLKNVKRERPFSEGNKKCIDKGRGRVQSEVNSRQVSTVNYWKKLMGLFEK